MALGQSFESAILGQTLIGLGQKGIDISRLLVVLDFAPDRGVDPLYGALYDSVWCPSAFGWHSRCRDHAVVVDGKSDGVGRRLLRSSVRSCEHGSVES